LLTAACPATLTGTPESKRVRARHTTNTHTNNNTHSNRCTAMPAASCATANTGGAITLKGSANTVTEFFGFGINTILYQRGIYPPEQFERRKK